MEEIKPGRQAALTTYKYDGVTYHSTVTPKDTLQKIEKTYFRAEDIFIATYPKSGMYIDFRGVGELR